MTVMTDFLRAIWGEEGVHYLTKRWTTDDGRETWANHIVKSPEHFQKMAKAVIQKERRDIYFAIASFKNDHILSSKGFKQKRVQANILHTRALYIDIDVKDSSYSDQEEALDHLDEVIDGGHLPEPTYIVNSGYGIHVYWVLTEAIDHPTFKQAARAIIAVCDEHDLQIDPQCTSDICRVLRPPGTRNFKRDGNKPVSLLSEGDALNIEAFQQMPSWKASRVSDKSNRTAAGDKLAERLGENSSIDDADNMTAGVGETRPRTFSALCRECPIFEKTLAAGGSNLSNEPPWHAMCNVMARIEDGDDHIDALFGQNDWYDRAGTLEKMEAHRGQTEHGPYSCEAFKNLPDFTKTCRGCRHFKNEPEKSPWHHAVTKSSVEEAQERHEPILPAPYVLKDGIIRIEETKPDADGLPTTVYKPVIGLLQPDFRILDNETHDAESMLEVRHQRKNGKGFKTMSVALVINHKRDLEQRASIAGLRLQSKEVPHMHTIAQHIMRSRPAGVEVVPSNQTLGWTQGTLNGRGHGFRLGDKLYFNNGDVSEGLSYGRSPILQSTEESGDLSVWRDITNKILTTGNDAHHLIYAAGFAAPLVRIIGEHGFVLSITGGTGTGKTTAMRGAAAIWGGYNETIRGGNDTEKSYDQRMAELNSLPLIVDDIASNQLSEDFANLIFSVVQGTGRGRLTRHAELAATKSWKSILVVSSNRSLASALEQRAGGEAAGLQRIVEINMKKLPKTQRPISSGAFDENYGHAGHQWIKYIVENEDRVRKVYESMLRSLSQKEGLNTPEDRFRLRAAALLCTSAKLLEEIGLCAISYVNVAKCLVHHSRENADRIQQVSLENGPSTDLVNAFITEKQPEALYLTNRDTLDLQKGKVAQVPDKEVNVANNGPKRGVLSLMTIRWTDDNGKRHQEIWTTRQALQKWMRERKMDPRSVYDRLIAMDLVREWKDGDLGHGTEWMSKGMLTELRV